MSTDVSNQLGGMQHTATLAPGPVAIESEKLIQLPTERAAVSNGEIQAAVENLSSRVQNLQRNLNFSIDQQTGRTVIKVIDTERNEIVRQIPSEEFMSMAKHLAQLGDHEVIGLLVRMQV